MSRISLLLGSIILGLYPPPSTTYQQLGTPVSASPLAQPTAQAPQPAPPSRGPSAPSPAVASPACPQDPLVLGSPASVPPCPASVSAVPTPPGGPTLPPPATPQPMVMAVANVHKEHVLIFQVKSDGELAFLQKVPPGEAVDLPVTLGMRYAAVFQAAPFQSSIVVKGTNTTWLLRPAGPGLPPPPPAASVLPASGSSSGEQIFNFSMGYTR